jgi:hypothetical protein
MRERADRDAVDARLREGAHVLERDPPRRLESDLGRPDGGAYRRDRLAHARGLEVVEQDEIGAGRRSAQRLVGVEDLDLELQIP